MAFKFPDKYRITEKHRNSLKLIGPAFLQMISDKVHQDDGYFFFPRIGVKSGYFFLVKTTEAQGWRMIAATIPSSGLPPTWEEMHYIKQFFLEGDTAIMVHPGSTPYVGDHKGWVYLWYRDGMEVPPLKDYSVRKASFAVWLNRRIKRSLINKAKRTRHYFKSLFKTKSK